MVVAHKDEDENDPHPYWYARVISVFHVNVRHSGPQSNSQKARRMEFLWVRWFGRELSAPGGFATRRLHRIGFLESTDPNPFGFLDPKEVLRGVHLILAFAYGRTEDLLGISIGRHANQKNEDWVYYYVGM